MKVEDVVLDRFGEGTIPWGREIENLGTSFAKHSGMLYSQELARFSYISPSYLLFCYYAYIWFQF